jgi:hypothetical protein
MNPGSTVPPLTSITLKFAGILTLALGPISAIRPFNITTTTSSVGNEPVPSINKPPVITHGWLLSADTDGDMPNMNIQTAANTIILHGLFLAIVSAFLAKLVLE